MRAKMLAAGLLVLFPLSAAAQSSHDGRWSVSAVTAVGKCEPSAQTVVTIKDNRIVAIDAQSVEPWGYIDDTGTFVGHFSQGQRVMRANGTVKGDAASGPWSSNTDYCGGTWSAHKIN
ncbi:hypothetical protein [Rhodoblastus sp.]|uniref:hypothetical protein n=1 Tax=Rhodoblastus sp. TaxID=1962975 RepID=UPI003F98F747